MAVPQTPTLWEAEGVRPLGRPLSTRNACPSPLLSPRILAALTAPARAPRSSPDRSAHNALAPFGIPTSDVKQKGFEQKTQDAALNCQQCQDLNSSVPLNILKTS